MSLRDLACYTLTLKPHEQDPKVTELVSAENGREEHRFARVREVKDDEAYSSSIYVKGSTYGLHDSSNALTGAKLASVGYISEKQKNRRLQLHNPDESVGFDNTSKIGFEWTFVFEGNKYRWNKEVYGKDYICSLDRKPDPKVEICLARDSDSKSPGRLQILHYNIDRFPEIKDLRGLETLLVASLMCFVDAAQDRANPTPIAPSTSTKPTQVATAAIASAPPPRLITSEDFEDESDPNEILVETNTDVGEHVARAIGLLQDPNMLFLVIRTKTATASQKALEVSLGVTRYRHREGLGDLHQYVIEEDPIRVKPVMQQSQKGPKVINLDDRPPSLPASKPKWTGPPNIAIYLSSIELPDLKPKPKPSKTQSAPNPVPSHTPARPPAPLLQNPNTLQARPPPPRPGSLPTPSPPEGTGSEHRKSSFGRLFGR